MATILLHDRKGSVAATVLVDDEDFAALSATKWCRHKAGYAKRGIGRNRQILMHRQIMGDPPADGLEIDHVNRCKLDNRRANLRWVTRSENVFNVGDRSGTATGERNIYRRVSPSGLVTFVVMKQVDKKMTYVKAFRTLAAAVKARDLSRAGG